MPPDNAAASNRGTGRPRVVAIGTAIGIMMANVPQLEPTENAMNADKVIQLIEAPGFLDDPEDPQSLIKSINKEELEQKEQKLEGRMKRKILALRKLFMNGDATVYISDGRTEYPITDALSGKGTIIK